MMFLVCVEMSLRSLAGCAPPAAEGFSGRAWAASTAIALRSNVMRLAQLGPVLANLLVVFTVRADPKPVHASVDRQAQRAIEQADPYAVKTPIAYCLEMQRRMRRIGLELSKAPSSKRLNINEQRFQALPKPL
jgi:hypothetical protein